MITAEQLRAARALVRMEQRQLAEQTGVSVPTIKRMEGGAGPLKGTYENVSKLQAALEQAGAIFLSAGETADGGPGVRLRQAG